jgi:hypothetical protein
MADRPNVKEHDWIVVENVDCVVAVVRDSEFAHIFGERTRLFMTSNGRAALGLFATKAILVFMPTAIRG